jgi:hypothetical protein
VSHHPFTSDLSIGEFVFCHPLKGCHGLFDKHTS